MTNNKDAFDVKSRASLEVLGMFGELGNAILQQPGMVFSPTRA